LTGGVSRPALVKLGGSLLTGKREGAGFQRPAARRLLGEVRKSEVPTVLLHGAGSQGHPEALRHRIGLVKLTGRQAAEAVAETRAAVGLLHAHLVATAVAVGLRPYSISLESVRSEGGSLVELPTAAVRRALEEGFLPVLHGTVVRDDELGWRIASADELLAELAGELQPRLAVFATDIDGVMDPAPDAPGAKLLPRLNQRDVVPSMEGDDATGAMAGKLQRAFQAASRAPTLILNGGVRNRLLDALKGKQVTGTRVEP
jgi:isopentenyl phosphate kinase